ncbi:unnamed protein product [Brassica oleracea var. botrytis]
MASTGGKGGGGTIAAVNVRWTTDSLKLEGNRVLDACNPPGDVTTGTYGNFSETQTESQENLRVVGYEENLSGRQMLIVRVRTRSSLT